MRIVIKGVYDASTGAEKDKRIWGDIRDLNITDRAYLSYIDTSGLCRTTSKVKTVEIKWDVITFWTENSKYVCELRD